jgi:tight adherence protein B
MDPLVLAISAAVFLSFVLVFSALGRGSPNKDPMEARLAAFREDREAGRPVEGERSRLRQKRSYSGLPVLSAFLAQFKGSEKVAMHLDRAGIPLRVGEYYMIRWGMATLFFLVPFVFSQTMMTVAMAAGTAMLGYTLPAMWVGGKRKKRTIRINAQLVDMLGLVSNSLKSGYGLMQSLEFASKQLDPPLALELRRMLRDANLGLSAEDALIALGQRIDSKDLDMVLTAINIQRTVGGNLAEILDKVAFTMRERERIRGEISTLTAQQKMTGVIIGGLPVFMFLIFMVMNPDYMSLLFTETIGRVIIGLAVGFEFLGYLAIKRIMAIEV